MTATGRRVVVAGATGFVGQRLLPALRAAGYTVRGGTRDVMRASARDASVDWARLDVDDAASLDEAFAGADALVYLVHQMRAHGDDLLASERAAALRVRDAAERAGLRRIVYLGGPKPPGVPSAHLAARLATGEVLRSGRVSTIELQAGMIIGVGSESWLIVRDLALRLPVMVLPAWLKNRSEPVYIDDVVRGIVAALDLPDTGSACLSLPGPEAVAARALMTRVASHNGTRPLMIPVPILTPSLSSGWIRLVTRADFEIARQLVDGLTTDLLASPNTLWARCPELQRTPLDDAIRLALTGEPLDAMPSWQRRWERLARMVARRA